MSQRDLSYANFGTNFLERLGVRAMADSKSLIDAAKGNIGKVKARAQSYQKQASDINKAEQRKKTEEANVRPVQPRGKENVDVTTSKKRMVADDSSMVATGQKSTYPTQGRGVKEEQKSTLKQLRRKVDLKKAPKGRYHGGKGETTEYTRTYNGFEY